MTNISCSNSLSPRRARSGRKIFPAVLKIRSTGAEDAGIPRKRRQTDAIPGSLCSLSLQYRSGSLLVSTHCSLKKVVTSESAEMSIVSSMNANSDVRARLRGGPSPPTRGSSCVMSICILFASEFVHQRSLNRGSMAAARWYNLISSNTVRRFSRLLESAFRRLVLCFTETIDR